MSSFDKVVASRWNIDFLNFQINEGLENIYVFLNCAYYYHNIFNF
jgi:hypothetical protein